MHIPVKSLPDSLRDALRSVGYGCTDIGLSVADHFSAPSAYGDGCRASVIVVELATGRTESARGSWGGGNPFQATPIDQGGASPLPEGFAALTSGGLDWSLYLNPANAAPLLPARVELTAREAWILEAFRGLTSAGRKDEFSRRGPEHAPTSAEILESELASERRARMAMIEWFVCEGAGHATTSLDVELDGAPVLRLTIHGISRASGGVVVVSHIGDPWRDLPQYLDDLIGEWSTDPAREIRDAARLLRARRDEYCRPEGSRATLSA